MWWDYNEELHLKNVRQLGYEEGFAVGRNEGKMYQLLEQVVKKVRKNQPLSQIADDVEEEPETLYPIYEAVVSAAPDYDIDMIYRQLKNSIELVNEAH